MTNLRTTLVGAACFAAGILAATSMPATSAQEDALDERVFELRTYYPNDGKLDDLHARFRDHTNYLFVKHGMDLVGYWTPDDGEQKLVYMIAHEDRDAAKASWKAFGEDPAWQEAYKASREDGPLVQKIENVFLTPTDYSPLR